MNFYQCNRGGVKLTQSQIINNDGYAINAKENNPSIEGSLRNDINYLKKITDFYKLRRYHTWAGKYGWIGVSTIIIKDAYMNSPIYFEIAQRQYSQIANITITFNNSQSDPSVLTFTTTFNANRFFLYKREACTWDLYVSKVEAYDEISVIRYFYNYEYAPNTSIIFPDGGLWMESMPENNKFVPELIK